MGRFLRTALVVLVVSVAAAPAHAEWQLKPFGGVTFGGTTTFVNLDDAAGKPKFNLGISGLWLGEVLGLEGDVATTAGYFSGPKKLILRSHVATVTGNVVLALPKRIAQYSLRPYAVAGIGVTHVGLYDNLAALPITSTRKVMDLGGGATGFLSDFVGVNWDVRYFRTLGAKDITGRSVAQEQLSFWRATMGFSFRL